MPPIETLLPFFGISVILGLTPGPDNVFVLLQSAMRGPRAGMVVVLGLCTGLLVHTAAVAFGLAALFAASEVAFAALKIVGALYLAYLAWQAFRAPVGAMADGGADSTGAGHMYRRGVVMNLTNPKVVIFFLAFLPQFVAPAHGHIALQILLLGLVFIVATLLVFSVIAYFSAMFGALLLRSPRAQRALNWFAGIVFLGLAARLATAHL
ncbi:LysE family translocator [Cupriavidus sp. 2TAF22]|uniref:LysE family translocator n=1 Tax=unclassified Cupriavidus TaxID=2640874 RepID=UPI003F92C511